MAIKRVKERGKRRMVMPSRRCILMRYAQLKPEPDTIRSVISVTFCVCRLFGGVR